MGASAGERGEALINFDRPRESLFQMIVGAEENRGHAHHFSCFLKEHLKLIHRRVINEWVRQHLETARAADHQRRAAEQEGGGPAGPRP